MKKIFGILSLIVILAVCSLELRANDYLNDVENIVKIENVNEDMLVVKAVSFETLPLFNIVLLNENNLEDVPSVAVNTDCLNIYNKNNELNKQILDIASILEGYIVPIVSSELNKQIVNSKGILEGYIVPIV